MFVYKTKVVFVSSANTEKRDRMNKVSMLERINKTSEHLMNHFTAKLRQGRNMRANWKRKFFGPLFAVMSNSERHWMLTAFAWEAESVFFCWPKLYPFVICENRKTLKWKCCELPRLGLKFTIPAQTLKWQCCPPGGGWGELNCIHGIHNNSLMLNIGGGIWILNFIKRLIKYYSAFGCQYRFAECELVGTRSISQVNDPYDKPERNYEYYRV